MTWDDDSFADDFGERHPGRARPTAWQVAVHVGAYVGLVVGVVALIVGVIAFSGVFGTAANPGGFASGPAHGPRVAMPPLVEPLEPDAAAEPPGPPADDAQADVTGPPVVTGTDTGPIDPDWTAETAAATGIPQRALSAYALAHGLVAQADPDCGVDWATIAAIGAIESDHGRHGDATLGEDGTALPAIIGRALDGDGVARIEDTDGGLLDGDATWDRAVGPMQFIPSTWAEWGTDGNGDGLADPHQIDDAAQTTARYLCASGPMRSSEGWRAAVFSYNHDDDYVDDVARVANEYAAAIG
ncbi:MULTISPECIES: lytic transglycosylase domain-containing protein [unclassified Agromyces]|uniref:lytic transglycosylase domain-containing protein n=1 Tax=unclassified Agromyces TaxID=2639701 RepID=UPI0030157599